MLSSARVLSSLEEDTESVIKRFQQLKSQLARNLSRYQNDDRRYHICCKGEKLLDEVCALQAYKLTHAELKTINDVLDCSINLVKDPNKTTVKAATECVEKHSQIFSSGNFKAREKSAERMMQWSMAAIVAGLASMLVLGILAMPLVFVTIGIGVSCAGLFGIHSAKQKERQINPLNTALQDMAVEGNRYCLAS